MQTVALDTDSRTYSRRHSKWQRKHKTFLHLSNVHYLQKHNNLENRFPIINLSCRYDVRSKDIRFEIFPMTGLLAVLQTGSDFCQTAFNNNNKENLLQELAPALCMS